MYKCISDTLSDETFKFVSLLFLRSIIISPYQGIIIGQKICREGLSKMGNKEEDFLKAVKLRV